VLATGSSKGFVTLWDLELFKVVAVSKQTQFSITCLDFADEYPLLVACTIDGFIYVHSLLRDKDKTHLQCLARLLHLNLNKEPYVNVGVTTCTLKIFHRETLFQT
jgi:WD40 repeat protein